MKRFSYESDFSVVCDQGFGKCFSRGCDTLEEAQAEMESWQKKSHGSFCIQQWVGDDIVIVSGERAPTPNWF
jgi:hypothetical protein